MRLCDLFLTMADSSLNETVDNNPVIFENGSKARLLMNINEHARYYKSLLLFFLLLFFHERDLQQVQGVINVKPGKNNEG